MLYRLYSVIRVVFIGLLFTAAGLFLVGLTGATLAMAYLIARGI